MSISMYVTYSLVLLVVLGLIHRQRQKKERVGRAAQRESFETGMTQPPSLHPVIDPMTCIGCESCVHACPEFPKHQVLALIGGKAELVSPSDCIGHGACQRSCPVDAISLVFGTAERGVDIPNVNPDFSTNVPGVFIAGELGGMGLIRNAMEQGRQAMVTISERARSNDGDIKDVVIVGAGPAGIAATLGAMDQGLNYVTIEQSLLGGSVAGFPRGKLVMTAPVELPLIGKVDFAETTKEKLIEYWKKIHADTGMRVSYEERLIGVKSVQGGLLEAKTDKHVFLTKQLLLAIGRRGTPRRLGVPGEELPKIAYSVINPAEFKNTSVLVVGGGDSALEAAHTLAAEPGTDVTLSYRSGAFTRAKAKNRDEVASAEANGTLRVLMNSNVTLIEPDKVHIEQGDELYTLKNDVVIVCAGGIVPTWLLNEIGIEIETKHGVA
ncbi:MAG: NAD(P)-binding domain-containing protein [Gammaproteobacteria bacterium]|nr:NAD(P)-binding domain-containing protein [Gammaproteobacteria bacterium]